VARGRATLEPVLAVVVVVAVAVVAVVVPE